MNIFEAFRGGESRYAFLQIMNVYKQHFKINKFTVDPYQFGRDNPEAIESGAFWFYHRLGFRPVEKKLQDLAIKEIDKMSTNPKHRSTHGVLKKLADGQIELVLNSKSLPLQFDVSDLAIIVTKWMGKEHDGNHEKAWTYLRKKFSKMFNLKDFDDWPRNEKKSFKFLAPLIFQIKGLNSWSAKEKSDLFEIMKAKGGQFEKKFVYRCQKHHKLKEALNKL